jgi:uncharacterized Zn-binding protein involved in type VI secretion
MGDMTAHGGVIVVGFPQVLIGGQPAARLGDMHTCPFVDPIPKPHVGGPITLGSPTVLIGGQPAARMGDMATCAGPPDTIIQGCPTVLIGEAGSGSGGGGGGAGAGNSASGETASGALGAVSGIDSEEGEDSDDEFEGHFLDVEFVDPADYPIRGVQFDLTDPDGEMTTGLLSGRVRYEGIDPGDYRIQLRAIVNARWSTNRAKVGEKVEMTAETAGIDSGTEAILDVYMRDASFGSTRVATIETEVKDNQINGEWELVVDEEFIEEQERKDELGGFSNPSYYFEARAMGLSMRSGLMVYYDDIEVYVEVIDLGPVADRDFRLILPSGEVRKGTLDSGGYALVSDLPPGILRVAVDLKDKEFGLDR